MVEELKRAHIQDELKGVNGVYWNNQDFIELSLYGVKGSDKKLYNIKTKEIIGYPEELSINELSISSFGPFVDLDVIDIISDHFNMVPYSSALNRNFRKAKNLGSVNLSEEEPELAKALSNGDALYLRPTMVDEETWFNTLIHWFAPKGQDVMEIYATDKTTGEKTQIRSYADFQAWKEAHPDN